MVTMPVSCGRGDNSKKDHFIVGDEELHAEDARAAEAIGHHARHALRLVQLLVGKRRRNPRFHIVAAFLAMSNGIDEQRLVRPTGGW